MSTAEYERLQAIEHENAASVAVAQAEEDVRIFTQQLGSGSPTVVAALSELEQRRRDYDNAVAVVAAADAALQQAQAQSMTRDRVRRSRIHQQRIFIAQRGGGQAEVAGQALHHSSDGANTANQLDPRTRPYPVEGILMPTCPREPGESGATPICLDDPSSDQEDDVDASDDEEDDTSSHSEFIPSSGSEYGSGYEDCGSQGGDGTDR